jgi:hypothetical protein
VRATILLGNISSIRAPRRVSQSDHSLRSSQGLYALLQMNPL